MEEGAFHGGDKDFAPGVGLSHDSALATVRRYGYLPYQQGRTGPTIASVGDRAPIFLCPTLHPGMGVDRSLPVLDSMAKVGLGP